MRIVVGSMLVQLPSSLVSPTARNRRSARVSPESKPEVEDDRWGRDVIDCLVQKWIFLFSGMNEYCLFCYVCVDLFRAPKIMKIFV